MDEFGVLTEKYGLKPQGKSAPMAAAKRTTTTTTTATTHFSNNHTKFGSNSNSGFGSVNGFGFQNQSNAASSFDLDSIFNGSNLTSSYVDDDVFGSMPLSSSSKHSASVDDLLGGFGGSESEWKSWNGGVKKSSSSGGFDDLLSGFGNGGSGGIYNGSKVETRRPQQSNGHSYKPISTISADPFEILESASTKISKKFSDPLEEFSTLKNSHNSINLTKPGGLKPPPKPSQVVNLNKVNGSGASLIDELEEFAMGKVSKNTSKQTNDHNREVKERNSTKSGRHKEAEDVAHDLESFFGMSSRSTSAPRSRPSSSERKSDGKVHSRAGPKASQRMPCGSSASVKKTLSTSFDELSSIFGAASASGEFEEVEGENEERRRARLGRMQRTHERAARAVADMNRRDHQIQHEQEERRRIAETMDAELKRWAAGKEGNMRALLSSLHYVLWPECGWQPVSLTDMITSASVKKVYRKATLCVHPDKVQQKGASLQQKYIAEKVFDILKEAWNKFNKEELS